MTVNPCLGKLLERAIHTQVYPYYTDINVFNACESGFRKGHSTGTFLIDFLDKIYQDVDSWYPSGVLILDLLNSFDIMN